MLDMPMRGAIRQAGRGTDGRDQARRGKAKHGRQDEFRPGRARRVRGKAGVDRRGIV